ncbi:tyrosine-type recombinase/integrase [Streptomyces sp. SPB074]|uniref:tyrosine-type recombinase/integrase n=1 Tax=Streptomyces sp. (strain SPB074) TaxID=465543 RepID=UPI00017F2907|nr:tyrosine-type recombinase/integrase [Streptomyces sp. SPB074]EDY43222.1 PE-PGRS family protein [Streptomyces sp. SPB074]
MKNKDVLDELPELRQAVETACGKAPSEARARQIRAHARELVRALKRPDFPLGVESPLADILALDALRAYERLALAGELRDRGGVRPTSEATANVRSGVMVLLQRELGLEAVPLRPQEEQQPKAPVDVARRERMRTSLQTAADHVGRVTGWSADGGLLAHGFPRWVRALAMASVTLDTGARVGELCALRLPDLSPAMEEVRIVRRPQGARPGDPLVVEVYPLRRASRTALARWLFVRRLLMSEVTGGADAVWVSVRGNHSGDVPEGGPRLRPAGTPLQPRGAGRAYTAAVTRVNIELAGSEGWSPLPVRMEQLRRGVAVPEAHLVPPAPDAEAAAALMERLESAGRALAALPDHRATATTGRRARDEARHVLREAWRLGIEHQVQLDALAAAGLAAYDTHRAGWEPELLRALDRAARLAPL